jgi:hypothetical protein
LRAKLVKKLPALRTVGDSEPRIIFHDKQMQRKNRGLTYL